MVRCLDHRCHPLRFPMASPQAHPSVGLNKVPMLQDHAKWGIDEWDWNPRTCQAVPKMPRGGLGPSNPSSLPLEHPEPEIKDAQARGAMSTDEKPMSSAGHACLSDALPGSPTPAVATTPTTEVTTTTKQQQQQSRPGYCQADGCGKNLSKLTFYHARNKICDVHIKADVFSRNGEELRFCQRCGHPHALHEFDGRKHSCRAQLEKHNARRRKRQVEEAADEKKNGNGGGTGSGNKRQTKQQTKTNSKYNGDEGGGRRSNRMRSTVRYAALEAGEGEDDKGIEVEDAGAEEERQQVTEDHGSWNPVPSIDPSPEYENNHHEQQRAPSPPLSLLDFNDSDLLVDDLSTWLTSHLVAMEDFGGDGCVPVVVKDESIVVPSNGEQHVLQMDSPRGSLGLISPPLPQDASSFDFGVSLMRPIDFDLLGPVIPSAATCLSLPTTTAPTTTLPAAPKLTLNAKLSTISVKLFGCTPAELPDDLRSQLTSWFQGNVASLEGYLRPGCVHLTVQATVAPDGSAGDVQPVVQHENEGGVENENDNNNANANNEGNRMDTASGTPIQQLVDTMLASGDPLWRTKTLLVQTGSQVGLVHNGRLQQAWDVSADRTLRAVPAVLGISPAILLSSSPSPSQQLVAQGMNLLQDDCEVVCRLQGEYVPVASAGCSECHCAAAVRACCRSGNSDMADAPSSKDWESRCCGCCVSKLASLTLDDQQQQQEQQGQQPSTHPKSVAQQLISMRLEGQLRPGVLHVDVLKRAYMAPRGGRVLVVDSAAVHAELLALAARSSSSAAAWIDALGPVFEWIGDRSKMSYSLVEKTAAKLIHDAVSFGLIEVAKYLHGLLQTELMNAAANISLPRTVGGLDGMELLTKADQACRSATMLRISKLGCCSGGLTLLHRAVQSQKYEVLELVLGWGREAERLWQCDVAGPRGLTPLHLATLVQDPVVAARTALLLLNNCEPGVLAWKEAVTDDGLSPADFASRAGRLGLLDAFGSKEEVREDEGDDDRNEAPPTPRRCRCHGPCPCAHAAEPCASCASFTSDDDCCGGQNGTCMCCASSASGDAQKKGGCCGGGGGADEEEELPPAPKVRRCCH